MRILARFEGSAASFCAFVFGNGQGLLLLVHLYRAFFRQGRTIRKAQAKSVAMAGTERGKGRVDRPCGAANLP